MSFHSQGEYLLLPIAKEDMTEEDANGWYGLGGPLLWIPPISAPAHGISHTLPNLGMVDLKGPSPLGRKKLW